MSFSDKLTIALILLFTVVSFALFYLGIDFAGGVFLGLAVMLAIY